MDKDTITRAVRDIIKAIGENPDRPGLKDTPKRVAEMYEEVLSGIGAAPEEKLKIYHTENQDEMIVVKRIPFHSMCEHHLLPFFGHVSIAYIPNNNKITGFSSLIRVVESFARRLQLQERMATEIADFLVEKLAPLGVLVVIEAKQMCISMRGVRKEDSETITSAMRGVMRKTATRMEAFALLSK
ncbi:GTP cyclohydrolase I FolE [bacterium]|nr:GTP cyclohydrolase I FolE [FCB group bacterium]MBL7192211.1 GTP cyclohydrolase I FolE [bacterium]